MARLLVTAQICFCFSCYIIHYTILLHMLITLSAELSPLRSSGLSFSTFTLPKIIFTSSRFCKYLYKQQSTYIITIIIILPYSFSIFYQGILGRRKAVGARRRRVDSQALFTKVSENQHCVSPSIQHSMSFFLDSIYI